LRLEIFLDGGALRVVVRYDPGRRGSRRGHPDDWTENEPEEIEVESAWRLGAPTELTDDEERDALDAARADCAFERADARAFRCDWNDMTA